MDLYCSCTTFSSREHCFQVNRLNNPNTKEERHSKRKGKEEVGRKLRKDPARRPCNTFSYAPARQHSLHSDFWLHVEMPRGQFQKTRVSEPPAGRFPKFLLPWAAGRPQKLKYTKAPQSPMLVRVVGREQCAGLPGGTKIFRIPHIGFAGPVCQ